MASILFPQKKNIVALLLCLSAALSLNKTFDSIFPLPLSLILLFFVTFLHNTTYQKSSLKWYLIFLSVVFALSLYHFFLGAILSIDRLLVLMLMSFCIFTFISAPARDSKELLNALAPILKVFLYANFLFGVLQVIGVVEPFSFSKSHMHGYGNIFGINRNSFIFSEPSYNVVATIAGFILLNEMKAVTSTKSSSFMRRHHYLIITSLILLTTLSVTGLISLLLLAFYKTKIQNWKTYFYFLALILAVIYVLPRNDAISAVFERIIFIISNPSADSRLYDHYISLSCERDGWIWLFGNGMGNWYDFVSGCSDYIIHKTSNSILGDYLVETGLIGILAVILTYAAIFKNLKIVIVLLSVNLFFQLHLSAIGIIAFLISICDAGRHSREGL